MAPTADETNLSARKTSASEACLDVTRKGTASRIWDLHNQIKIKRSPFTVHRSPFTVHRSPFTVHRSPFTVHRSPFTVHRSPFAVRRSPFAVRRSAARQH